MLKWVGNTSSPVFRFENLFEAKTPIGTVKFHMVNGVLKQALVKTTDKPGAVKSGWVYWMQVSQAQALGIADGDIVSVTAGGKPLKPGEHNPDTGKPAPAVTKASGGVPAGSPALKAAAPAPAAAAPQPAAEKPAPAPAKPAEAPAKAPEKAKEPEPAKEPEKAKEPVVPPAPAPKAPEPVQAKKEPPKEPEVTPPSTSKETPKLKKKVPLGTIRYHSIKAGGPLTQAMIRATDDPNHKRGGWVYLMSVAEATKQGIHHDDVLSFTFTPSATDPMKGKVDIHKDENGHIKKISTGAQFPKPEGDGAKAAPSKPEEPKAAPKPEEPKVAAPEEPKAVEPPAKAAEPPKEEPPTKAAPEKDPEPAKKEPVPVKAPENKSSLSPEKLKELMAYLKGLPTFAHDTDLFTKNGEGSDTLFNKQMKEKYGNDWLEAWKAQKDAAPAEAPKASKSLSYDELPASTQAKLKAMGAGKGSYLAAVAAALISGGKQSHAQLLNVSGLSTAVVDAGLEHMMDHGYVTKHADGTYSLNPGWVTSPTPEAPKPTAAAPAAPAASKPAAKVKELPTKVHKDVASLLSKNGIAPDSSVGKIIQMVHAHGELTTDEVHDGVNKSGKLTDYQFHQAANFAQDHKLLKVEKGKYSLLGLSSKATEPDEPEVPKTAVPAKAASTTGMLQMPPSEIPDVADLKYVASGAEQGMGGTGEKHIYKDKKGHEWLFKVAIDKSGAKEKPFAAHAQESFSAIAQKIKSVHIPLKVVHIKGKMGTLQPLIPNSGDLKHAPSPATLTPMEREDVASEHILDWLMSQHDSFGANLIRTKTGRIIGIDKEQGFKYFGVDKLSTDYQPNTDFHSEKPPYYNQFWNEWTDKKFDFDPTVLKKYIDSIDALDDDKFVETFKPYNESFWEDKPKKQEEFNNDLRKRKKNIRGDFENFLTDLYKKRTGHAEGAFTFKSGWVPGSAPDDGKPKKVVHKYNSADIAGDYNLGTKAYNPLQGPDAGKVDPTKIAVKTGTGAAGVAKLAKFAKEMNLTPFVPEYSKEHATPEGIIPGKINNWAFFDKAKWDAATVEKTEEIGTSVGSTPHTPEFKPDLEASPPAHSNLHELEGLHHVVIPELGKRLTLDGGFVEGQFARAKKFIDKKGDPYYLFQFKLRKASWENIKGGSVTNWKFNQAKWDPGQHAFVESGGFSDSTISKKWTSGDSEIHLATDEHKWSYMGSMYAKVRPAKGQTPAQALHTLLEGVEPGLANKVLTPPTPEEREVVKLSRVLWSVAPKESDGLSDNLRTVSELKKRLKKHGYDEHKLSTLQEVEAFPGYATWTKPGRYKEIAKGKVRYLFNGISDDSAALSIMKYGLLGIHERNLLGLPPFGGSYGADVASGSGDGILTRAVTDSGFHHDFQPHAFSGTYRVLVAPTEIDRLDTYVHPTDMYGTCRADNANWTNRKSVEDRLEDQAKSYNDGLEMSFRKGIGKGKLLRMVCDSEDVRKNLINQAKQQGIMQVNGVPVDDFVVVCDNLGDAYEKYIKPLGF